jgi:hypothetical protein
VLLSPEIWIFVGAFVVDIAGAVPMHRTGLVYSVLPGSTIRAKRQEGSPGTWEVLLASMRLSPVVGTGTRTPGPRLAFWTDGSEASDAPHGNAKRRQRSAA